MRQLIFALVLFLSFNLSISPVSAYYTNMPASVVIGQPDFTSGSANQGGSVGANTISIPQHVAVCNEKLVISDASNNRVLIFNSIPTSNNASANVVVGQSNFTSNSANQGGSPTANSLNNPNGVTCMDNKLIIGDAGNNRILIYNSIPTSNNALADVVIGQSNFTSNSANQGGSCNSNTLFGSGALNVSNDSNNLYVADRSNSRVLIFTSLPTSNNASADIVVGQPNMTTCLGNVAANKFHLPRYALSDGTKLYVSEQTGNRVLIFNQIPNSNGASADVVVGQTSFTSGSANQGGSASAHTLSSPKGIDVVNGRLIVSDQNNHRTMIWNQIPTSNNAPADIILGQPTSTSNSANQGGLTGVNTMSSPQFHLSYGNKLFVPDFSNNRILIFENIVSTPLLSFSKIENIDSGKLKLFGNVQLGESQNYTMQFVKASVNGQGENFVSNLSSAAPDGDGKNKYEFSHDFEPWVGFSNKENWREDDGYTLKVRASSLNADESTIFYISPFKLLTASATSLKFSVPKQHIQNIKDNIDHFEIYNRNIDDGWIKLGENILTSQIDVNGIINVTETLSGEVKVVAVSKDSGWRQDSNILNIVSDSETPTSTSKSPLQINNLSGNIVSTYNLSGIKKQYTFTSSSPTFNGIAYANSLVKMKVTNNMTQETKTYTVTVNSDSSFQITPVLFPNSKIVVYLVDTHGKYTFLPEFKITQ